VRKKLKKMNISAIEIQRMVLGWLERKKFEKLSQRMKLRKKDEKERQSRLHRIRTKEKEFAFLKHLSMPDYLDFEKLRFGSAARFLFSISCLPTGPHFDPSTVRIIQRGWKSRQQRMKWNLFSKQIVKHDPLQDKAQPVHGAFPLSPQPSSFLPPLPFVAL
jgi:hypothetical protein